MRIGHRTRSRVVEGIADIPSPDARGMPMDINTAAVLHLKSLCGIDGHYAKKIVEGRPYRDSEELLTRHILHNTFMAGSWIDS